MAYQVFGASVSPFVRKVLVFLAEKTLAVELDPVNPFSPPDNYRETSPLGRIPAFRDGDKTLADSSVICAYLERRHPTPALMPADDYAYARALWFEEYIDSGFAPVAGGNVFRPLVILPMMKQPVTADIRAEVARVVREDLAPMWDYLEGEIAAREFFVGDAFSLADISVASIHVNLLHAGVDVAADRWPQLAGFIGRMFARPSFRAIIDEETPIRSRREP